jgi:plastocyanin
MFRQVCTTVAIACLFGCGGSGGGTAPIINNTPPPPNGISVENDFFSPTTKTVTTGTAVVWAWNSCTDNGGYTGGQTCVTHNIVFDDGVTTSGPMSQGTFTRTFATAGTYNYHCSIHGAALMSGSITVQ